jgi:hypothetical protein
VIAQSLENILMSEGITRAAPRVDLYLTMGMAFLGAIIAFFFSRSFRSGFGTVIYFSSVALAGAGYFYAASYVFVERQLWIAVAGPLFAMLAAFLLTTIYSVRTEDEIRDFVLGNGGIEYAYVRLDDFIGEAVSALDAFPASAAKDKLVELARYNAVRKK